MAGRQGRRGWGRIRQLPNKGKRYQANYTWPPMTTARHNAPTTFSTRALAERWLADERRLIERGQWAPPKDRLHREMVRAQTFGDYATRWVEERRLKESSRKEYRRLLASFITDTLGPLPLHALDAAAVRSWCAALETTEHRKLKVYWFLHSICATAVSDGHVRAVAAGRRPPPAAPSGDNFVPPPPAAIPEGMPRRRLRRDRCCF